MEWFSPHRAKKTRKTKTQEFGNQINQEQTNHRMQHNHGQAIERNPTTVKPYKKVEVHLPQAINTLIKEFLLALKAPKPEEKTHLIIS